MLELESELEADEAAPDIGSTAKMTLLNSVIIWFIIITMLFFSTEK